MKSSIDFLNRAMQMHSGYQLTKMLGLSSTGVVSTWKKRQHVSPYYAAKLAEITGHDPRDAVAIAGAEAEPDPEKREYLRKLLEKISANFEALLSQVNPHGIRLFMR